MALALSGAGGGGGVDTATGGSEEDVVFTGGEIGGESGLMFLVELIGSKKDTVGLDGF